MSRAYKLTAQRLREVLDYDRETGTFTARISTGSWSVGKIISGCPGSDGHLRIKVDRVLYGAHRLAWLHVAGEFPQHEVDHIDGNPANNRWTNLRDVPHKINAQNKVRASRANRIGLAGVNKQKNKFRARIRVDGKLLHIGYYPTAAEAHEAHIRSKRQLHAGCTL